MTMTTEARWWVTTTLLALLTIAALTNMAMLFVGRGDSHATVQARGWFSGTMNNIDRSERERRQHEGLPALPYPPPTSATQP